MPQLCFLALASPELSVIAITTVYGNGPLEVTIQNAYRILHAANRTDVPIYARAYKPLVRDPSLSWALHVHGAACLREYNLTVPQISDVIQHTHAAIEIINRVMAEPGQITLITLGRLNNLALALSIEPNLATAVSKVVVMDRAIHVLGNVSKFASANFYEDPESAAILYQSGAPIVQVGLDVCNEVEISQDQFLPIQNSPNSSTQLLTSAAPVLQSYYREHNLLRDHHSLRFNDIPAVAYAIDKTFFASSKQTITIETHDEESKGQTRITTSSVPSKNQCVEVCLSVDVGRLTKFFRPRYTTITPRNKQDSG